MQQGTERKGGNILSKNWENAEETKKEFKNIMEHCSIRLAGKGLTANYLIHQIDFMMHLQQVVSVI